MAHYITTNVFKILAAKAARTRELQELVRRLSPSNRKKDSVNQVVFEETERIVRGEVG